MNKNYDNMMQQLGNKATQSSDQLLAMTEQELIRAETKLEEAIAHLSSASRMHKKAMEMVAMADMTSDSMMPAHGKMAEAPERKM